MKNIESIWNRQIGSIVKSYFPFNGQKVFKLLTKVDRPVRENELAQSQIRRTR
jgi:hypothetical protein